MLIAFLVFLFIIVFAFLAWRIVIQAKSKAPEATKFVCPECDEIDCICHEKRP